MTYVEYLRARRVLARFALLVVAIALVAVLGALFGSGHVVVDDRGARHVYGLSSLGVVPVPVASLFANAGFIAIGVATALATGLNRETGHAHLVFVWPASRVRMALAAIAVDVATIVASAALVLAVTVAGIAIGLGAHARFVWSGDAPVDGALALGVSLMWYAILQAVTAWAPPRSAVYAIVTGIGLALAIPLSHATFLGPIATLAGLVLYVDPFAYLTSVQTAGDGGSAIGSILGGPTALRALAAWALAAAFLALATLEWRRVEV